MSKGIKSRKLLLISTVLTIIAIALVLSVYGALLGTFNGNSVTVTDFAQGAIQYSADGSTWSTSMTTFNATTGHWYARFEVSSTTYTGTATITFTLQEQNTDGSWSSTGTPVTVSGYSLTSTSIIYASSDGSSSSLHDFSGDISSGGTYRISVTVASG